ncbi:MAG TPA: alpha/beta hydrolase [Burkholderiales bacterium]|nr:alpha/beta hydrolase [Burkholderiales bacterium]
MHLRRLLKSTTRGAVRTAFYLAGLVAAVLATIVVVFAVQARVRLPDLQPWHRIELAEEFRAGRVGAPRTFPEYLALEERLFAELRRRVLDDPAVADRAQTSRYNPASVPAQLALGTPYNRSYELVPQEVRGAVLLVHGLTDSPYTVRALAEVFHARGFYVLALRLPGHGTVPAGLLDTEWTDWYAAVELAARHAAQRAGGKPFYGGGYSTGAPLVALLAVRGLEDATLPRPQRLFLVSAAIGVSKFAALANIASTLSFLPYFEKAKWLDVLPEYDPYKYNSFSVNAGNQVFRLTRALQRELDAAAAKGVLDRMPRVTAFQSVVDSTVNAAEVIHGFMRRLPGPGNELVAFDVNRGDDWAGLVAPGPREAFSASREAPALPFRLIAVSNRTPESPEVAAFTREAGTTEWRVEPLSLAWPPGVFSVGHVALPFAVDDPVYGLTPRPAGALTWTIGDLAARGEAGALAVPLGMFARLRSNPFFDVVRARVGAAIDADAGR